MVVTIITPFDPSEPYIAAVEASFNTSIDSMSEGLMLLILVETTPSTTNKGLASLTVLIPLTLIVDSKPVAPLLITVTPAARPCKAWSRPDEGRAVILSEVTDEIAPVTVALFWVP